MPLFSFRCIFLSDFVPFLTGGGAGDSLSSLNNTKFATRDRSNINTVGDNCPLQLQGGWWVSSCDQDGFLTGRDEKGNLTIRWRTWRGASLTKVEMKVKPTTRRSSNAFCL